MNRIRNAATIALLAALLLVTVHDLHRLAPVVPDPIAVADAQRQQLMFGTSPYAGGSVPLAVRLTPDGRIQSSNYVRTNATLGTITTIVPGTAIALAANGNSTVYFTGGTVKHQTVAVVTGAPTGCSLQLTGSLDGVNFYSMGGALTCTATVTGTAVDIPALFIRYTLSALAGGTTPSVAVQYGGA
jgi:hypothetical protein